MDSGDSPSPVDSSGCSPWEARLNTGSPGNMDFMVDGLQCYVDFPPPAFPFWGAQDASPTDFGKCTDDLYITKDDTDASDSESLSLKSENGQFCDSYSLQWQQNVLSVSPSGSDLQSPVDCDLQLGPSSADHGKFSSPQFDDLDCVDVSEDDFYQSLSINQKEGINAHIDRLVQKFKAGKIVMPTAGIQSASTTPYTDVAKSRKRPRDDRVVRPMNAFMVFSKMERASIVRAHPVLHNAIISKHLGLTWKGLPSNMQLLFKEESARLHELHKLEHPDYRYRPQKRRATTSNPESAPKPKPKASRKECAPRKKKSARSSPSTTAATVPSSSAELFVPTPTDSSLVRSSPSPAVERKPPTEILLLQIHQDTVCASPLASSTAASAVVVSSPKQSPSTTMTVMTTPTLTSSVRAPTPVILCATVQQQSSPLPARSLLADPGVFHADNPAPAIITTHEGGQNTTATSAASNGGSPNPTATFSFSPALSSTSELSVSSTEEDIFGLDDFMSDPDNNALVDDLCQTLTTVTESRDAFQDLRLDTILDVLGSNQPIL